MLILNFEQFVNEKMGVVSRVNQDTDVFKISEISNDFINKILKNPDKKYETTYLLINKSVYVVYDPKENPKSDGFTDANGDIKIYKKITEDNFLKIKYLFIHELIHVIQQIRKKQSFNSYSYIDRIRYNLRKVTMSQIHQGLDSDYFMFLIYREDCYEITAWGNNAYASAFKYKLDNPDASNQDVVKHVLEDVKMNKKCLDDVIELVKNNETVFQAIIGMLIGHFSEIDGNKEQSYFDKSVFELNVVKKMRKEVKRALSQSDEKITDNDLNFIIMSNISELLKVKNDIIKSFIEHMKYWFNKAQKQIGKTIQLGIDDATEQIK